MRFVPFLLAAGMSVVGIPAHAVDLTLQNDGFVDGASVGFQSGFIAGEIGAVRLHPPDATPRQLKKVQFLFGGSTATRDIELHIYADGALTTNPGAELYSNTYQVTGANNVLHEIDLTAEGIMVTGPFRVGIEFTTAGLPSIARDGDGTITGNRNFILASGFGWVQSNLLGLTGDWIIRAVVGDVASTFTVGGTVSGLVGTVVLQNNGGNDLTLTTNGPFTFTTPLANGAPYSVSVLSEPPGQDCVVVNGSGTIAGANVTNVAVLCGDVGATVVANDGFLPGAQAGFQSGFVAGEIAAARLVPSGPTQIQAVRFLYGGAPGTRDIILHVWNDAGTTNPGSPLYSQIYSITASDIALQEIDLSAAAIAVSGGFRVGIEFLDAGLPSVARDDDGTITANRNFIFSGGLGWVQSASLGLTGDWIIRAVVGGGVVVGPNEPAIQSIADIGNDQGRSVRIRFAASGQDSPQSLLPVVRYEAFRRIDPLLAAALPAIERLDGWEFVGSVPSHGETIYNIVAPTLVDSTAAGVQWSVFFIRAATESPFVFYDSPVDSGYSVDNLAPAPPQNLTRVSTVLSWNPAPETDFAYWSVYGSDTPNVGPGAKLLGTTASNGFSVAGEDQAYFLVTAHDFAGNESDPATVPGNVVAVGPPVHHALSVAVAPNPFNPATSIVYELPTAGPVRLQLFDARGRHVETVLDGVTQTAGVHHLAYRSELSSGSYFLRIDSGGISKSIKVSLVR